MNQQTSQHRWCKVMGRGHVPSNAAANTWLMIAKRQRTNYVMTYLSDSIWRRIYLVSSPSSQIENKLNLMCGSLNSPVVPQRSHVNKHSRGVGSWGALRNTNDNSQHCSLTRRPFIQPLPSYMTETTAASTPTCYCSCISAHRDLRAKTGTHKTLFTKWWEDNVGETAEGNRQNKG